MTEENEFDSAKKPKALPGKAWRIFKHVCRGLFLVYLIRIGMSFMHEQCDYLNEAGVEIVHGHSLHKGYAYKIRFRNKTYETHVAAQEKLKRSCENAGFTGFQTFAPLADGKIFVAGHNTDFNDVTDGTWLYDSKTNTKVAGPKMTVRCIQPELTALRDGRILLTGGFRGENDGPTDVISIYDPSTSTIKQIGKLLQARAEHSCLQINSYQVLIVGGRIEKFSFANPGETTGIVELVDLKDGKSKLSQIIVAGGEPFVIRDDNKDIFVIGGFYKTSSWGDTRWHGNITKLTIPRDQVD